MDKVTVQVIKVHKLIIILHLLHLVIIVKLAMCKLMVEPIVMLMQMLAKPALQEYRTQGIVLLTFILVLIKGALIE